MTHQSIENATDDELVALCYAEHAGNPLIQELAKRLEQRNELLDALGEEPEGFDPAQGAQQPLPLQP